MDCHFSSQSSDLRKTSPPTTSGGRIRGGLLRITLSLPRNETATEKVLGRGRLDSLSVTQPWPEQTGLLGDRKPQDAENRLVFPEHGTVLVKSRSDATLQPVIRNQENLCSPRPTHAQTKQDFHVLLKTPWSTWVSF